MAKISTNTAETTFQIKNWLGLNESPDGDTDLKIGEASVMRNFRVTREWHPEIFRPRQPICRSAADTHSVSSWAPAL